MTLYERIVDEVPQLKRGMVWCVTCGDRYRINTARSLSSGWPQCCGQTMTIDSPEERERLNRPDSDPVADRN